MSRYLFLMLIIGLTSLGMAFMPAISKKIKISYSVIYVVAGMLLYIVFPDMLPSPMPQENKTLTLHLTELIVIIALMGTGIKIDRAFSVERWATPLRMIFIAMTMCIAISTAMGLFVLNLALPSALLLGAVLAPTDPVLASDVQVGPPGQKRKFETKFALTSEAGLNDGMAFPFIWLAILATGEGLNAQNLMNWVTKDFFYKILAGLILGLLCGKLSGYLVFSVAKKYSLLKSTDGFLAFSLTLCVYALTETLGGYGFIAVFLSALTLRNYDKGHNSHEHFHSFTDQIERILLGILLIFFGGTLVSGILKPLTFEMAAVCLAFLLIVRPVSSYLSLLGTDTHFKEKLAISFFGIRGMGSVFYLSFAFAHADFSGRNDLWAMIAFTILVSILMHGLTAGTVLAHIENKLPKQPIP
ncbi:MAG: sodium:proton antiporter [Chitinophagaceae bacterium]|nr:MAG: sodium:proton antiporter [Chitinophagaceae bacterium]